MNKFKLLDNPEQAFYFADICTIDASGEEIYEFEKNHFGSSIKIEFIEQVCNNSNIKKQAGYSKTKSCNFISLILVCYRVGDGEFRGHSIKKTYIIQNNNKTEDAYKIKDKLCMDEYGQISLTYEAAYHVLPDGKLLEFKIKNYEKEVETIYETVSKIRMKYDFENKFPEKDNNNYKRIKI